MARFKGIFVVKLGFSLWAGEGKSLKKVIHFSSLQHIIIDCNELYVKLNQ